MTWTEAQQRGVALYVSSEGQIRVRPGTLTRVEFEALRHDRDRMVAEWLWSLDPPPLLAWHEETAWAILRLAAWWLAGRDTVGSTEGLMAVQEAVDQAWRDQNLQALVETARRWVMVVYEKQQAAS